MELELSNARAFFEGNYPGDINHQMSDVNMSFIAFQKRMSTLIMSTWDAPSIKDEVCPECDELISWGGVPDVTKCPRCEPDPDM